MKNSRKIIKRICISLIVIALIASSVFAIRFHEEKQHAIEMAFMVNDVIENLQGKLDSVAQKSLADELFINGKYDSAMLAYENIPNGGTENEFIRNRKSNLEKMSNFRKALKIQAENAENRISMQQSLLQMEMMATKSQFESSKDSITSTLTDRILALENQLQQKEQELAAAPKIGRLVFYNAKGTKINYFGEVKNGKANGQGIGNHATGSVYDGEWQDNRKHGKGTYRWVEGEVYEGDFVKDKREGEGTYRWPNGNKYVGKWENDQRSGSGKLYDKDNKIVVQGDWKNDEIVNLVN